MVVTEIVFKLSKLIFFYIFTYFSMCVILLNRMPISGFLIGKSYFSISIHSYVHYSVS